MSGCLRAALPAFRRIDGEQSDALSMYFYGVAINYCRASCECIGGSTSIGYQLKADKHHSQGNPACQTIYTPCFFL